MKCPRCGRDAKHSSVTDEHYCPTCGWSDKEELEGTGW